MDLNNQIKKKYIIEDQSIPKISSDLDVSIDYIEKVLKNIKKTKRSSMETSMLEVLREIYPLYDIQEQVYMDGLFLDFYIKTIRLGVETDGRQHSEIIKHWHGKGAKGITNFNKGLLRDLKKEEYLTKNNIHLIRVSYKEKIEIDNIRRIINDNAKKIMDNLVNHNSSIRL